jgi:TolB-like protein/Tfp pilus assembly protein PilF
MLAILPFENLGEADDEYFADGITEELISKLTRIDQLGVIATTSVMYYKETEKPVEVIGKELGVDYILEGSIRWQRLSDTQNRVRITPQLIRVADRTHLWADTYQRDMTDIFVIQEEIAEQVARALDITLLDHDEGEPQPNPTDNLDAYRAYLEGRFWWNKRSSEGFKKAVELFEEAIEIDPDYALAYAGKAECYCMLAIHLARPIEQWKTARAAAEKALSLDPDLAEAHTALGWVAFVFDYDYEKSERHFLRAIELNPRYATAYNWYGVMLACSGRGEEAVQNMIRAQQLDPASLIISRDLGCVLSWVGRLEDAERQLKKTIEMDPSFAPALAHLGRVYTATGRYDDALAQFEKIREFDSGYYFLDLMIAYTHARAGRPEDARQRLTELLAPPTDPEVRATEIAILHYGLGDKDEAFKWLNIAVDNREFGAAIFSVNEWLGELRQDPHFDLLRQRIGLVK